MVIVATTAQTYFTDAAQQQIDVAVSEAEQNTSGEIVPVLAGQSGTYERPPFLIAIWAATLGTLVVLAMWTIQAFTGGHVGDSSLDSEGASIWHVMEAAFAAPFYVLVPVQIACFLGGYYFARNWPPLWLAFVPHSELEREVHRSAREAFAHFKMSETRDASGIMIYVSLFERMVVVLADQAINAKHSHETWDKVRDLVIEGFRKNDAAGGYIAAIQECGRILAADFPRKSDDTNELPNHLRIF